MRQDNNSLAHTTWNCKYHIVFAPKYRRQIIYGKYKASIGQILRLLCERKGVEIHEAEACPDHIHMLVSIPPKLSISSFNGQSFRIKKAQEYSRKSASPYRKQPCDLLSSFTSFCQLLLYSFG